MVVVRGHTLHSPGRVLWHQDEKYYAFSGEKNIRIGWVFFFLTF